MLRKTIEKKGNSNFILIPKTFMEILGIKTKDKVSMKLVDNKIIIEAIPQKK